tara:strand:+ start:69 stop:275 length:207 start_codon:yes stop_codon:yes gene_type:complete
MDFFQQNREIKNRKNVYQTRKNKFLCIRRCLAVITNSRTFVLSRVRDIGSTISSEVLDNAGWRLGLLQ